MARRWRRRRLGAEFLLLLLRPVGLALLGGCWSAITAPVRADEDEDAPPAWTISVCVYEGAGCVEDNLIGECLEGEEEDDEELFTCSLGKDFVDCITDASTGECESCPKVDGQQTRPATDEDEAEDDACSTDQCCVHEFNSSPFGEGASGMADVVSKASSTKSYMRLSCTKDGKNPYLDDSESPTLSVDFFQKDDCSRRECLHTVDLMNDICKSPDCKLDPPPGEALREKDPNCGCGMCRPKFPAGWVNGQCYDLCMDNSDGGTVTGQPQAPHYGFGELFPAPKELTQEGYSVVSSCKAGQVKSAKITWEGEPCANELKMQGFIVLAAILIPSFCVICYFSLSACKKKELLCWRPNSMCCGVRLGRRIIELEDKDKGLSKYEIRMRDKQKAQSTEDRWAAHRREERLREKRHARARQAGAAGAGPGGGQSSARQAPGGGGRSTSSAKVVPVAGSSLPGVTAVVAPTAPTATEADTSTVSERRADDGQRRRGSSKSQSHQRSKSTRGGSKTPTISPAEARRREQADKRRGKSGKKTRGAI